MSTDRERNLKSCRVAAPFAFGLVALFVALPSGCDWPGKPNPADRPVAPRDVLDFGTLFQKNCAGCHGAEGKLGPAPPLHDSLFRALVPEAELQRVVSAGRPGTPMPAFAIAQGGTLTPMQIQVLVYEVKGVPYKLANGGGGAGGGAGGSAGGGTGKEAQRGPVRDAAGIAPKWGLPKAAAAGAPAYLSTAPASIPTSAKCEQIRQTVFARACADCHGDRGQGGSQAGPINDAAFLALISDQGLRRLILTGRTDLGMPDYASSDGRADDFKPLTSEEINDLVDLLASWRIGGGAAGGSQVQANK